MGREYVEPVAFESMRALLEIVAAEDYTGKTQSGDRFEKANFDYKVVSYEEQDEDDAEWAGEVFTDGGYYKNGGVPPRGKLPNIIVSAKSESYFDDLKAGRISFEPDDLIGCRLRAQVEVSEKGYSNLVWNTIGPEKKPRASRKAQKDLEEQNARDLEKAEKVTKANGSSKDHKARQKAAEEAAAAKTDAELDAEANEAIGKTS